MNKSPFHNLHEREIILCAVFMELDKSLNLPLQLLHTCILLRQHGAYFKLPLIFHPLVVFPHKFCEGEVQQEKDLILYQLLEPKN